MKKLHYLLWIAFACLVWLHPCPSYARHGGITTSIPTVNYPNACPQVSQNWCVGADGWTVFTPSSNTNSGTCNNSGGTSAGSCIILVSSSLGNNTTCSAQQPSTLGVTTSSSLSSITNANFTSYACADISTAQTKVRAVSADWIILKKGDTWSGGINGVNGAFQPTGGPSAAAPMLISAGGVGARPQIVTTAASDIYCISSTALRGQNLAVTGISCYNPQLDPASASYLGSTITADTGVANCGAANIICNINAGAGLPTNITGTNFYVSGNGINNFTPTVSITAGATSITMSGSASFTATQMHIQVQTKFFAGGFSFNGLSTLLIVEDCAFNYTNIGVVENTTVAATTIAYRFIFRRNMMTNQYNASAGGGGGGGQIFLGPTCPNVAQYPGCIGVTYYIGENVMTYGGWNPKVWAAGGNGFSHNMYLHNPSPPVTLDSNINAYSSSDNQWRDGGTAHNNLFISNAEGLLVGQQDNNDSISYNVVTNGTIIPIGVRTATAVSSPGSTTVSFDGVISLLNAAGISDLSNPGAIPNNGASVGTVSATGITLGGGNTVKAGIRGDGVQIGDTLSIWGGENSTGIQALLTGLYVNAGPASGGAYAAGSTGLTVSSATPAIVTEPSASFARSQDEPFQFTAGTLPSGGQLALSTTYCSDPANGSATAYPVYAATAGACTGGADIATTGTAGSGLSRTGSRLFKFATASQLNWPYLGIPAWVTPGMSIYVDTNPAFPGANGLTTVASISSDRFTLITTDASNASIIGGEQRTFVFGLGSTANFPTARIGPNNVIVHSNSQSAQGTGGALSLTNLTSNVDYSGNYIYNWDWRGASSNLQDASIFGTNTITQVLNSGFTGTPDTRFPTASVEGYDASIVNNSFTGTITGTATFSGGTSTSYDGGTLTTSGASPNVGDTIFCASCAQYLYVVSGTAPTFLVSAPAGTMSNIGPVTMTSGSVAHFLSMASQQSKETGWNATWTAAGANNFIRTNIQCGNQTLFPGSPACAAQN